MSIKRLLCEEIQDEIGNLKKAALGDEEYKTRVDGIAKLVGCVNDIDRLELERREKELNREIELELKQKQLKDEKVDRRFSNWITIGGIVLPLAVTIWGTKASFKFEKDGTITTIMGRGFISKMIPKK